MKHPYYRQVLRRELDRRLARNASYSLRAFAKTLDVPASTLSRALNGQRTISLQVAARIADGLALPPRERSQFLNSLASTVNELKVAATADDVFPIAEEQFRVIADWYHYAILEMTFLKGFKADARQIASRLGIEQAKAQAALERLERLGLLERIGSSARKTKRTLWVRAEDGGTTPALLTYQRQCLELALKAIDTESPDRRTSTAMAMPIDPAKLPLARRMIEEFAMEVCRTLATGGMTDIYQLTINFHSLLKGELR